ncbi:hypothetical protein RHSIM_Rhsim01G0153400 [Rhododendron simsii]|uniref:PCI domain-containing protein n=1 Tax=Rhododendron simsii TaxID=118357 RepID=A0A834HJA1_RHOSS|nr:hypothetical protein RHSIM_Rhsim01G0153400 [Rhododendron simsii]
MGGEDEASAQMIDEIHANGGDKARRHRPITNGEQLDVEAYATLYSGRTKVTRLLFIADRCGVVLMQLEALRMAYDEAKKGENTQLFREIVEKIDGRLGPSYGPDKAWADSVDRRAEQKKEKLENELNAYRDHYVYELNDYKVYFTFEVEIFMEFPSELPVYEVMCGMSISVPHVTGVDIFERVVLFSVFCLGALLVGTWEFFTSICGLDAEQIVTDSVDLTNLIKESIRMGCNDFGDFFYAHGALGDAFKNYVRTRDYCTTSNHVLYMCLNAILVSIEMGQFTNVSSYVAKSEQTPDALGPVSVAKLRAAAGLALLEAKKYKLAARKFLETGHELGNRYSEVIALQDIATYGGLCALASFDRTELKATIPCLLLLNSSYNKVIDNLNFRNFLELVPEVRELIHNFYSSHYASCLDYLGNLKANLLLDIHLHDHVETMYEEIRHKALIQYTHPFVSVDLGMMANAFKTSVAGLEKELEALITDNQIQARIDSHNKILYARHADQRNATFQQVLQTGCEFDRDVKSMLLRASLIKHDYKVRSSRKHEILD